MDTDFNIGDVIGNDTAAFVVVCPFNENDRMLVHALPRVTYTDSDELLREFGIDFTQLKIDKKETIIGLPRDSVIRNNLCKISCPDYINF